MTRNRLFYNAVRRPTHTGFTLIELLVTVALAAMVMTLGIPSFQTIIDNNRMATQVNDFIADLNLARSEAVKRRANAVVCIETGASDNRTCDDSNSQWHNGWVVFIDADGDGKIDSDEVIKRNNGIEGSSGTLKNNAGASATPGQLIYNARGRISGDSGRFVLCDARGADSAREIQISGTGRVSLNKNVGDGECTTG